ncbi:phage tail protein [Microbulbifer sp. 2201CG32-9]|uniref:hypothetical protein n=1 Tax=Microbulbifer sp. 2201CG32-9 TaxID=3232309 RepID=UPI00345C4089
MTVTIPKPGTPSSITVPATDNNGSFSISWGTSSGTVSRYELWEQKNSNSYVRVHNASARSKSLSGRADATYKYRVRACNDSGCSGWRYGGNSLTVRNKPGAPGTPNNPTSSSNGSYTISWAAASGTVTYYLLQESSNNGSSWTSHNTGTSRSFSVTAKPEGSYLYRVTACNTYSWSCATGGQKQTSVAYPAAGSAPSVPSQHAEGVITVSWSERSGNGYRIRENQSGRTWDVDTDVNSYLISTPASDGSYTYSLASCMVFNEGGGASSEFLCGSYSSASNSMVYRKRPSVGAAPSLSTTQSTSGDITVSWTKPSGTVDYYYLEKELGNSGSWQRIGGSQTDLSEAVIGLADGDWRFRILACNSYDWSCSTSSESAEFRVRSKPAAPAAPGLGSTTSTGSVSLDWANVSDATYYDVQKRLNNSGSWSNAVTGRSSSDAQPTGLTDGLWDFRVRACNEFSWACSGYGNSSSDLIVRVEPATPAMPYSPATSSSGSYDVSWSATSGSVTHYLLQESVDDGISWNTIFTDIAMVRSYSISNELEGNYLYRVIACKEFGWACATGGSSQTTVDFPNVEGAPSVPPKNPGTGYLVSWSGFSGNGFILTEHPSGRTWQDRDITQLNIPANIDGEYTYTITNCLVFNEGGGASDEYQCGDEGPPSSKVRVRRPPVLQGGMGVLINTTNGDITVSWPAATPNGDYYQVREVNTAITKTVYEPNLSVVFPARDNGDYSYEYYACNNLDYCSAARAC